MKKKYLNTSLILLAFSLLTTSLFAQEVDHVYLKSGTVLRGNILEIEPADHVKIEDLCGNIWYYKMSDVDKITSEPYLQGEKVKNAHIGFKQGFVNMTSIGFLAGSSSNPQMAPFSLVMVNGWRSELGFFAGAGLGIEFLSTNYMPFFLDLRYDLFGSDVVPYVVAKGGYSVPLSSDHPEYDIAYEYSGGPLFGAGVGLKIKTRNHFAWDIALLYRYQETGYKEVYDWNNQTYDYTDVYNRIEIRLGFYID
ncbi:MAG: hypothetical protein ABFS28_02725 [Bacteroidota bacterium]